MLEHSPALSAVPLTEDTSKAAPDLSRLNARGGWRRVASAALAAVALLSLAACELLVSDETRLERAAQLQEHGDYRAAGIELKKILEKNPDNQNARLRLGELSLLTWDADAAERELRRARELGIPADEIAIPLGRALLMQGRPDRVLVEVSPAAISDAAVRTAVLALHGEAYLALGRLEDADKTFRQALAADSDMPEGKLGLARVEQRNGNLDAADAYVSGVLASEPNYVRAWLARGDLALVRGSYPDAEEAFSSALTLVPLPVGEELVARDGLAESQWRQGKSAAALESVERLLAIGVQHPRPKYFRALIAFSAGDYATAIDYLRQVVAAFPDYGPALLLLGASHYAQNELEQASSYLRQLLIADPSNVAARKVLAATNLRQRKPQSAIDVLAPAIGQQQGGDSQLLAMLGRASVEAGDTSAGVLYLERGSQIDPGNPGLQMELAAGYLGAGQPERARDLLNRLPEAAGDDPRRDLLLIMIELSKGDRDRALDKISALFEGSAGSPDAHNLAGTLYMAAGEWARARAHLEAGLERDPNSIAMLTSLARLDIREGKDADARARLERVLKVSPGNLDAHLALAELAERRGDAAEVGSWLQRAAAANPQVLGPKLLLVRQSLRTGALDQARLTATELARTHPSDADVQNVLGVVQMAGGRYDEAVGSFRKAVAAAPGSANFWHNLARAQIARQDLGEAKKLLNRALELQPDHAPALSALAVIEMGEGNATQALERARRLQRSPIQEVAAAGYALEGDLRAMQGNFAAAAQAYDAAAQRGGDTLVALKLYQARRNAGLPDSLEPLRQWLNSYPGDERARLGLAQGLQESGRLDEAAAQYEMILAARPDIPVVLNNVAWLYYSLDDPRALQMAERAHRLQPENGAITDTLGWLLVQSGDVERGLELLRKAAKQAPDIPDIRYHLGVALVKSGAVEEARRMLAELVNSGQEFESRDEAKALLRRL